MADSLKDKARKARYKASNSEVSIAASETVNRNAKAAKVNLSLAEERAAKKIIAPRMDAERERTASRAEFIAKREAEKAKQERISAATGTQKDHYVTSVDRKTGKSK